MSDAEAKETRNAVVFIEGKPKLELGAEVYVYPITTPGDRHKLMVSMRAYEPYAVKKFYDEVIPRRKARSTTERAVIQGDRAGIREFVMGHFLSFEGATLEDGTEPTPVEMADWLHENPAFVERIFREGVDALKPSEESEEETPGKAILVFGKKEHRVPFEMRLYAPERKTEEVLSLVAVLERFQQPDKHRYEKAIAYIENSRKGESFVEANWDVIEQLCNHKLLRLEGAVINGEPCVEGNREAWIPRLPMIAKIYAAAQATQDIDIKNA